MVHRVSDLLKLLDSWTQKVRPVRLRKGKFADKNSHDQKIGRRICKILPKMAIFCQNF